MLTLETSDLILRDQPATAWISTFGLETLELDLPLLQTPEPWINPPFPDITPCQWPLRLEDTIPAQGTHCYVLTLKENQALDMQVYAAQDIDLQIRDRFGCPVAEDWSEGVLSACEVVAQGTGEYLVELFNRSQRDVCFEMSAHAYITQPDCQASDEALVLDQCLVNDEDLSGEEAAQEASDRADTGWVFFPALSPCL